MENRVKSMLGAALVWLALAFVAAAPAEAIQFGPSAPSMGNVPYFAASRVSSNQTFTSATWTELINTSTISGSDSGYNASTGTYTPLTAGTYDCTAQATFAGTFAAGPNIALAIMKNGAPGTGTFQAVVQTETAVGLSQVTTAVIPDVLVAMNGSTDTLAVYANATTSSGSPSFVQNNGQGFVCQRVAN